MYVFCMYVQFFLPQSLASYAYEKRITTVCLDWLQSLKQFFINVSYHILVASLTLMAQTEPSELDWLQVYDMTH